MDGIFFVRHSILQKLKFADIFLGATIPIILSLVQYFLKKENRFIKVLYQIGSN